MRKLGNVLWGLVLVAIGLIFTLNALEVTSINIFFTGWWTLFIIVPCFIGLFTDSDKTGNLIGLGVGVVLLLSCQNIIDFELVWKLIIPFIIIIVGLKLIFGSFSSAKIDRVLKENNKNRESLHQVCATFGGQDVNYNGQNFDGVELTAVFGGIKCDLRNATILNNSVINVTSIFGGIDIMVPDNVEVKISSTAIFGGIDNKKKNASKDGKITIYVNGTCLFGGVDVK